MIARTRKPVSQSSKQGAYNKTHSFYFIPLCSRIRLRMMQADNSTLLSPCKTSNESHHAAFKASVTIKREEPGSSTLKYWRLHTSHGKVFTPPIRLTPFHLSVFLHQQDSLPPSLAAIVFRSTIHFAGSGLRSSTLVSSLRWRTCSRQLIFFWLQILQQTGLHRSDSKQHSGAFLHVSKIRDSKSLQIFITSAKTS
jgi:hypothetical protein